MATQAYPYMVITDGTTTVTIQDGSGGATNYPLVRDGWAPSVAGLRTSPLTGYTPYEDVVETFTIEINGATAAAALANLATLRKLLDQAARWYRGENVTAVLLKIAPHGSTISATATPLQAAILGGAVGGAGVRLSPRWDEVGRNSVIPNVEVSIIRRGLWLQAEESASGGSVNNGDLATMTFAAGAQTCLSPCRVTLNNFAYGKSASSRAHGGFLLLAENAASAPIAIVAAESLIAAGAFSVVTPSGSTNPRNTDVLRYTPAATTEVQSANLSFTLPAATNLVALFANIRPSATISFTIRAKGQSDLYNQYTPYIVIPANATQFPKWQFLGVVAKSGSAFNVKLAITASAASSSLDIDTVVACDARLTQVLALPGPSDTDENSTFSGSAALSIDNGLLAYPVPQIIAGSAPIPFSGDAVFVNQGASVYGVLLATGGGSTGANGDEYRQANVGTDAVLANTWTVYRRPAYLVPQ